MVNSRKTIWVINQFAGTPSSGWGERHFFLSRYWLKAGYYVTIISGSYNHMFRNLPNAPKHFNFELHENRLFCWVKTPRYKSESVMRFWSFLLFALKVYFIPVKKAGKPDIIIVSSMPIFPILSAYWLKKRYKAKKLLFEIRDIWPLSLIELGNVSPKHPAVRFIGWFERFGYKNSDQIISLLPHAYKHFEKIVPGCSHKFVYIPNGIDQEFLNPEPLPEEVKLKIPEEKFIVGYTGTIGLANALEYLIDAAKILEKNEKIFFVIIGEGYLKKELERKSRKIPNVIFLPKIMKGQVLSAITLFDICFIGWNNCSLYQYGVSANKYFDYMLAGKPILDSNNHIGDPVELSGCGIIVKPESAEAIAEGILQFLKMPSEHREAMGKKGRDYVKKYHSIKYLSEKYINVFQS